MITLIEELATSNVHSNKELRGAWNTSMQTWHTVNLRGTDAARVPMLDWIGVSGDEFVKLTEAGLDTGYLRQLMLQHPKSQATFATKLRYLNLDDGLDREVLIDHLRLELLCWSSSSGLLDAPQWLGFTQKWTLFQASKDHPWLRLELAVHSAFKARQMRLAEEGPDEKEWSDLLVASSLTDEERDVLRAQLQEAIGRWLVRRGRSSQASSSYQDSLGWWLGFAKREWRLLKTREVHPWVKMDEVEAAAFVTAEQHIERAKEANGNFLLSTAPPTFWQDLLHTDNIEQQPKDNEQPELISSTEATMALDQLTPAERNVLVQQYLHRAAQLDPANAQANLRKYADTLDVMGLTSRASSC